MVLGFEGRVRSTGSPSAIGVLPVALELQQLSRKPSNLNPTVARVQDVGEGIRS